MINLITSFYKSGNNERDIEIETCLKKNYNNKFIDNIYLLNDMIYPLDFLDKENITKIIQIKVDDKNKDRLYYNYIVNFINENISNDINIIANSDIYYDETINILKNTNMDNKFFALSRYDNNILYNSFYSQDSWIFQGKLNINLNDINFRIGTPGCDNRIAAIIRMAGYNITNPSKSIRSHHLHNTNFRTYTEIDKIYGDYLYLMPCEL